MAGWQPRGNPTGLNLLPVLGNILGNPQQLVNQLHGLQMPQAQVQQRNNRQQYRQDDRGDRRQFSDDYYDREQSGFDNYGERGFRERYNDQNLDERDYPNGERGRIRGLMDNEIRPDYLFQERDPPRQDERYGRAEFNKRGYSASKPNLQSESVRLQRESRNEFLRNRVVARLTPSEVKYGKRDESTIPLNAMLRPNCYLVPPVDDKHVLPLSEKQPGSRTIFVGSLPGMTDEFIITEIFSVFGSIENISLKSMRKITNVRHCHLRFAQHNSVDMAVKLNGYLLVIGDGSDAKTKVSRIRVNFHDTSDDVEIKTVNNITENKQKPVKNVGEEDSDLLYSRKKAFQLLDLIRCDKSVVESLEVMARWFKKGECNRTTVNVFHTMLSTINSFVKRLINKRKEHEQKVEIQKREAAERANDLKQQCDAVWNVFDAATKQKSWDHFTKGQRKTISQWFAVIRNEIKSAQEAEIQNREEVGMDLDDDMPNVGGLIEQPALQMAEEQKQEDDESSAPSAAKKQRCDASVVESDAGSTDALKLENEKLRTQVESLKGIAEQNTNLIWSMQSYQYQVDMTRQHYNDRLKQKDFEILRLQKALQYVKQNMKDKDLLTGALVATGDPLKDLEVVVELSNDTHAATGLVVANYNGTDGEEINNETMEVDGGSKVEQITGGIHNKLEYTETELVEPKGPDSRVKEGEDSTEEKKLAEQEKPIVKREMPVEDEKSLVEEERQVEGEKSLVEEESPLGGEKPLVEDEKQVEGEIPVNKGDMQAEGEKTIMNEETPDEEEKPGNATEEGEKPEGGHQVEEEKDQAQEEDEEEEGCGRFVEIDDEQFEVIDDMDEDSDDDYKEVAAQSSLNENDEQVNEQLPVEYNHEEVAAQSSFNENTEQVNEQVPTDLTAYQQSYLSYYQAWASSGMASYGSMGFGSSVVRLSGEELVLVGIICSYLQLCPSGATSGEIRDYLSRQFNERRKDVVERLLFSLPVLFKTGESGGNTKWKFCGFEMAQSKSES